MLKIERELVNTESAYVANEIIFKQLDQLHTQLGSFELQATVRDDSDSGLRVTATARPALCIC